MAIGSRINWSAGVHRLIAGGIAAIALAWSADGAAFEVKKTQTGQDIRWYRSAVTYHLDHSVDEAADGAADAITAAASSWSNLDGAPALSVVRGGGGDAPGYDGLSTIFFAPEGSPIAGGALAVTVLTYDGNGQTLDADVIINGRYDFAVLSPNATPPSGVKPISNESPLFEPHSTPFDLHHVVAHELGHTLGLADEKVDSTSLMFLYTSPGAPSPRAPTVDDSSGVASLYDTGTPTGGSSGCGGASVSPRTPTNASSRISFAVGLGLVAWGFARRRRGAASKLLASTSLLLTTLALLPAEREAHPGSVPFSSPLRASARARVTHVEVTADAGGLFTTRAKLQTTTCLAASCPPETSIVTYGGTIGGIHQVVLGATAPREGDEVDVAFDETTLAGRLIER
jgi:hypothetical protein